MRAERYVYALASWTVEKRARGWYFTRSANRHSKDEWKGPYCSESSVAMMIARELRQEIIARYERQKRGTNLAIPLTDKDEHDAAERGIQARSGS